MTQGLNLGLPHYRQTVYDFSHQLCQKRASQWCWGKEPACQSKRHKRWGLIPGSGRSPGEGMATHSSILAWKIPWMEEPDGLQSMGLQRDRHD